MFSQGFCICLLPIVRTCGKLGLLLRRRARNSHQDSGQEKSGAGRTAHSRRVPNFRGTGTACPRLVVDITPENLTMPYF
jgi:hypothetical protein